MVIAGLDVGTTGCKIALYDENAALITTYYHEYEALHQDGCHEIHFDDVKNGVFSLLQTAAKEHRITALGVTSFGESFAMLDENDNILAPSMLYTDPRGKEECAFLCQAFGEERLTLLSGVKPHPMYSISKILWHKNHQPDVFAKCKRILLGEDFIVYSLTGVAQIDYSLAARTGAFDIEKKCFIKELFDTADIDISLLSTPVPAESVAGEITEKVRQILGIDYTFTVVNGCHDQVAAMIGSGVFAPYQAMDGTGTVECIPVILEKKPTDIAFYDCGYSVVPYRDGQYACYALSFTGGATLKWFRDNFAQSEYLRCQNEGKNVYAFLDQNVPDDPTGILVLPHFAGAATPYMDNDSTAAFVGITLETTKYHLYKALMEGTCYEMLLNFRTMQAQTGNITELRATGGGAASDTWLQIKADILDMDITALACKEIGAAGTAALAGKAVGAYDDLSAAVAKMAQVRGVFCPQKQNTETYRALYQKYKNLYTNLRRL